MTKTNSRRNTYLTALSAAVAVGAIVAVAPVTADAATSFTDVKAELDHSSNIMSLAERGILKGYSDGSFRPDTPLTRGQASKILALSLGLNVKTVKDPGFKDLKKSNGYYNYIAALANAGLITGFEDKTFKPNAPMTRAHMAKVLDLGYKLNLNQSTENPFTDVSSKAWYADHVRTLVDNKVTKGKTATTFEPNVNVTRAQMASFVVRSENFEKVAAIVQQTKDQIRAIVLANGTVEVDGKKVAESSFDPTTNTLTLTAYNMDEGVKALQGAGLFSDKLPELGVTDIRVADGTAVNVATGSAASKTAIQNQMVALLKETPNATDSDLAAKDIKVTLFGHQDGTEFWETFNVNLHVFVGE